MSRSASTKSTKRSNEVTKAAVNENEPDVVIARNEFRQLRHDLAECYNQLVQFGRLPSDDAASSSSTKAAEAGKKKAKKNESASVVTETKKRKRSPAKKEEVVEEEPTEDDNVDEEPTDKKSKGKARKGAKKNKDAADPAEKTPRNIFGASIWERFSKMPYYVDPAPTPQQLKRDQNDATHPDKPNKKKPTLQTKMYFGRFECNSLFAHLWKLSTNNFDLKDKSAFEEILMNGMAWTEFLENVIREGKNRLLWGSHSELCKYLAEIIDAIITGKISVPVANTETYDMIFSTIPMNFTYHITEANILPAIAPSSGPVAPTSSSSSSTTGVAAAAIVPALENKPVVKPLAIKPPMKKPASAEGGVLPPSAAKQLPPAVEKNNEESEDDQK